VILGSGGNTLISAGGQAIGMLQGCTGAIGLVSVGFGPMMCVLVNLRMDFSCLTMLL
jgi:hypothetical protein